MKSLRLIGLVFLAHLFVICFLVVSSTQTIANKQNKVRVRTIALKEKSIPTSPISVTAPQNLTVQKENKKTSPSPTPSVEAKKPLPTKKSPQKNPSSSSRSELAAKLKANLDKIEKNNQGKATKVAPLAIESFDPIDEASYKDDVALYIKHYLILPDRGQAKIALTLNREGRVEKISFLTCDNAQNRSFIEKELKKLLFPSFGAFFRGENNHTFQVTLNSH